MDLSKRRFSDFIRLVREYKLEDRNGKATAHTSAAAVRLDQLDDLVQAEHENVSPHKSDS
jgi:hypothetical protein